MLKYKYFGMNPNTNLMLNEKVAMNNTNKKRMVMYLREEGEPGDAPPIELRLQNLRHANRHWD